MPPSPRPARPDRAARAQALGPWLRPVPTGYEIDRWPITVAPYPDEQRASWLTRLSARYAISVRAVFDHLAVAGTGGSRRSPDILLDEHLPEVAARLGMDAAAVPAPDGIRDWPVFEGVSVDLSVVAPGRFCGRCLDENPYWPRRWLRPWMLACPTHGTCLSTRCPGCGERPWSSTAWHGGVGPVHECGHRVGARSGGGRRRSVRARCGFDLRSVEAFAAPDGYLDAQGVFDDLLSRAGDCPDVAATCHGMVVSNLMRLHVFGELLAERIDRYVTGDPTGAEVLRLVLIEAVRDFRRFDTAPGDGIALTRLLGGRRTISPVGPGGEVRKRRHSPVVTAAVLAHDGSGFAPGMQLQFRFGRARPAYPVEWLTGPDTELVLPEHRSDPLVPPARWVPQVLWPGSLVGVEETPLRRVVLAMCLLKLGRAAPWSHIAVELGLPAPMHFAVRAELHALHRSGQWPTVLCGLERLFERLLADPPPLDYRVRRLVAADPEALNSALDIAARSMGEPRPDDPARARFWELFTGGDATTRATAVTGDDAGSQADFAHGSGAPSSTDNAVPDGGRMDLYQSAFEQLCATTDISIAGPLTWRPP